MQKKQKDIFLGKTQAFHRFSFHNWKTEELLKAGLLGLEEGRKPIEELIKKVTFVGRPKGRPQKNYKPKFEIKRNTDQTFVVDLDARTTLLMKNVMNNQKQAFRKLKYHYYNILAVSIWGSFETYIFMLFEELFKKKIEMLNSSETITFSEAVQNSKNITLLLTEKVLDNIGHYSFNELLKFLEKKINYKMSIRYVTDLDQFYLIRNILAHNSGIIRNMYLQKIPKELIITNEIRLTKSFLNKMQKQIRATVINLEKYVIKKFY